MHSDYQLWILIGSQIISVGALFLQLNNKIDSKFDSLSKEINEVKGDINEMKVEQAKMEARIEGRLGLMEGRLSSLEQTVRYILDCFPKPKISIQSPQENN
jgi:flagellar capping protein FliD